MKASKRKSVDRAVRDAVLRLLESTASSLRQPGDPDAVIHGTRKSIKRLRAAARLVQHEIGDAAFDQVNRAWRETARALGPFRESRVLSDTLERVATAHADLVPAGAVEALACRLRETHARRIRALSTTTFFQPLAADLSATRQAVADWSLSPTAEVLLEPGLRRSYRGGRRAMQLLADPPEDEALHDWRKRVKDLWAQLRLIERACPNMLEPLAAEFDRLTEHLGQDHDCVDFLAHFVDGDQLGLAKGARGRLRRALAARRQALQADARRLAGILYLEPPRRFSGRIVAYARTTWD